MPALEPLTAATDALLEAMRVAGYKAPASRSLAMAMARRCVRAYQEATPRLKRLTDETRAMVALAVGESVTLPAGRPQAYRARMKVARRILGAPAACWSTSSADDGSIVVTRLVDGAAPVHCPRRSPRAVFLASLTVSMGWVPAPLFPDSHTLTKSTKVMARRICGRPGADWTTKRTSMGMMIREKTPAVTAGERKPRGS